MSSVKKILLVYPEIPKNTYWSFDHALPFIGKKCAMPPLSLITVAAYFPEHCRLRLLDMNIERESSGDILLTGLTHHAGKNRYSFSG